MHMTDRGLLTLVRHEGIVPGPYLDVKQVWTFGIGHTAAAGPPDPATMARGMPGDLDAGIREAFRVFRADLARYEVAVLRAVKVPLAPHEFDALVSFHYNTGGIAKAALTRHLNAGNRVAAANAFLNWRRPASIIPRRERSGALAQLHPVGLGLAVLQPVTAAFELAQEGSKHLREIIDLLQLDDPVIDRVDRAGFQSDMRRQLFGKAGQQALFLPLIAVGLDKGGFVLGVDLPLPVHASQVLVAVHEGRGDQPFAAVGHLLAPHPEMLDVDAAFLKSGW
jgi:GH24 family phage-related lysozyme (muramidase)